MFKSVLSFLYFLSVAIIVILPIAGSYLSAEKPQNPHHVAVVKGVQCHDYHLGGVDHTHHWDLIKNKHLSRPPVNVNTRLLPAFTIVLAILFLGLSLASIKLKRSYHTSQTYFSLKSPIFLLHSTFLI